MTPNERIDAFLAKVAQVFPDETKVQEVWQQTIRELPSHGIITDSSIKDEEVAYRGALRYASYPEEMVKRLHAVSERTERLRADYSHNIFTRHIRIAIRNPELWIAQAAQLLENKSYGALICGLAFACGRREYEVCCTAEFEEHSDPYHMWFVGQVKRRSVTIDRTPRRIPFLVNRARVCEAMARLQSCSDFSKYAWGTRDARGRPASDLFDNDKGNIYRRPCTKYFAPLMPGLPMKPQYLRKVYQAIAYRCFAPEAMSVSRYISEVLGHADEDLHTAKSYEDFYIPQEIPKEQMLEAIHNT
jgi:hypothetical protein